MSPGRCLVTTLTKSKREFGFSKAFFVKFNSLSNAFRQGFVIDEKTTSFM